MWYLNKEWEEGFERGEGWDDGVGAMYILILGIIPGLPVHTGSHPLLPADRGYFLPLTVLSFWSIFGKCPLVTTRMLLLTCYLLEVTSNADHVITWRELIANLPSGEVAGTICICIDIGLISRFELDILCQCITDILVMRFIMRCL